MNAANAQALIPPQTPVSTPPLAPSELAGVKAFSDLSTEDLEWLAGAMVVRQAPAGEILMREGETADYMSIVLKGGIRGQNSHDERRIYAAKAGDITGLLPFSRLKIYPLTSRAVGAVRIAMLHKDRFSAMLTRIPVLGQRLAGIMADRIRNTTKLDVQREKMLALGRLSAGLAHELNNPASAARRAASGLRESFEVLRIANSRLDELELTAEQRALLSCVEKEILGRPAAEAIDPLERSDHEQILAAWLSEHKVHRVWELAAELTECGFDTGCLDDVAAQFDQTILEDALVRMSAAVTVRRLVDEIENSTSRIADLVQALKEYSFMDQAPEQEVDIQRGLESTLMMMSHRLTNGIEVRRDYDPDLPLVSASSELNQVWTNLIDNALDAMQGRGVLLLRTGRELERVVIVIGDTGPGIPPEIQTRVFEPFFTTKPFGKGLGLGLDLVYRIVDNYGGSVRLQSVPGDTRFEVQLPAARPAVM